MRYVRFRDDAGDVRRGEWTDDEIVAYPNEGSRFVATTETYDPDDVEILPPTDPSKVVCIGKNYADHAAEMDSEVPDRPLIFLKGPNAVAAHGDTLPLLPDKERIDYEAELGVVIGERCRNVAAEDVDDVIAGYTCFIDVSNRDDQRQETNWIRGKAFDDSAPIGPVVASPEDVPDDARVQCRLNGETVQDADLSLLIFSIPELIEEITTYMTLEPGDVIATGTPEGVGELSPGDTVEVEVEGVGTLEVDFEA